MRRSGGLGPALAVGLSDCREGQSLGGGQSASGGAEVAVQLNGWSIVTVTAEVEGGRAEGSPMLCPWVQ